MFTRYALALSVFFAWTSATAAVPQSMDYQAFLSNSAGTPIDGPVSVTFAIYAVDTGGAPLWSETRSVDVQSGLFSVDLGTVTAFPAGLFDTPLWVGVSVAGDPEMTPRRALTTAAFSFKADDALSLQGQGPAQLDQSGDVADLDSRLSAVESNEELNFLSYDAGLDGVDVDGRLRLRSNNSGALTIEKAPGAGGGGNPTEVFFNQVPTDGAGKYGVVGYNADTVFLDIAGGQDEFSVNSIGQAEIVGPDDPRLTIRTPENRRGAVYLGNQNHGIRRFPGNDVLFHTSQGNLYLSANGRDSLNQFVLLNNGFVGIGMGSTEPTMALEVNGDAAVDVLTIRGGADIVEGFDTTSGDLVEPGSVMVIDSDNPGKLRTSDTAYDSKVAGVVSGAGGVQPGIKLGQDGILDGDLPMAMSGRIYVKCSTENGPIRPGDRLTTSSLSGHAMRATDRDRADGAVIGKAMSTLDEGAGLVLVLVNLQ